MSPEIVDLYRMIAVSGTGIIGLLVTIIATIFNSRQNKHSEILRKVITFEEFEKKLDEEDKRRMQFHAENTKRLDAIADTTERIAVQAIVIGKLEIRIEMLEKRDAYIGQWKHEVVDPYIPNEVVNLERRVAALESEMIEQRRKHISSR